jgi:hypothetical protein
VLTGSGEASHAEFAPVRLALPNAALRVCRHFLLKLLNYTRPEPYNQTQTEFQIRRLADRAAQAWQVGSGLHQERPRPFKPCASDGRRPGALKGVRSLVIDGEHVVCDAAGLSDFYRLHFYRHDRGLCVWAFDLCTKPKPTHSAPETGKE